VSDYTAASVTVSNSAAAGTSDNTSGVVLAERLKELGFAVTHEVVVPDGIESVAGALRDLVASVDLIITTGGTGLSPTDLTPEGTAKVIDRPVPGLSEAVRADTFGKIPFGMLSRGISGISGRTLIVNLPGSPKAVAEGMAVIGEVLNHAVALAVGDFGRHD
jgi:molybdenum cofactor synthesis domain-containing protein